jgi:hypothetical protein
VCSVLCMYAMYACRWHRAHNCSTSGERPGPPAPSPTLGAPAALALLGANTCDHQTVRAFLCNWAERHRSDVFDDEGETRLMDHVVASAADWQVPVATHSARGKPLSVDDQHARCEYSPGEVCIQSRGGMHADYIVSLAQNYVLQHPAQCVWCDFLVVTGIVYTIQATFSAPHFIYLHTTAVHSPQPVLCV